MVVDFHTHSTESDGALTPDQLMHAARDAGVSCLAITDHDTLDAYRQLSPPPGLNVIPGVEFSTHWRKIGIHILGLNVCPQSAAMGDAVAIQSHARQVRAERIAQRLAGYGVDDPLTGARRHAGGADLGRPHFARHMVESGFVASEREAFKKFLGNGKPCDFKLDWSDLEAVIRWIQEAGGTAVLAHPAKYQLTRTKLAALLDDFQAAGGEGLEVVSGRQLPNVTRDLAAYCRERGLLASWGSDFHRPGQPWAALGRYSTPPPDLTPVWDRW